MIDNRELALLIWLGAGLALFLLLGSLRSILFDIIRIVLNPVLVIPVLLMAGWVGGTVFAAVRVGWWEAELATETAEWFVGTALVLMFSVNESLSEERFFRRTMIGAVKVTVLVAVFVNLYVFSLWIELILLPTLTVLLMFSMVPSQQRFACAKALIDWVLALAGFVLFSYVAFQVVADWQDIDKAGALRKFALPVWLTIGIVPFVYLFSLYVAYEGAFKQIDLKTDRRRQRWRAKHALVLRLHVGIQDIAAFRFYWAKQAAAATSFRDAIQIISEFKASRRTDQRAKAQAQDGLLQYAGVDGVDDDGRRLDQREFKETIDALRALATAQMGWYRNRGGRYRLDLLEILQSQFERSGLPSDHGISLWIADDGQSWWAYRRTVTGWCFAVGAAAPPPDQWLYDGSEPPTEPPGEGTIWGERWGLDAKNW